MFAMYKIYIVVIIKHLKMNRISALTNPLGDDMLLNKSNMFCACTAISNSYRQNQFYKIFSLLYLLSGERVSLQLNYANFCDSLKLPSSANFKGRFLANIFLSLRETTFQIHSNLSSYNVYLPV